MELIFLEIWLVLLQLVLLQLVLLQLMLLQLVLLQFFHSALGLLYKRIRLTWRELTFLSRKPPYN